MRFGFPKDCALELLQLTKVLYYAQIIVISLKYLFFLLCAEVFPGQYIGEFRQSSFRSHITPRN